MCHLNLSLDGIQNALSTIKNSPLLIPCHIHRQIMYNYGIIIIITRQLMRVFCLTWNQSTNL